MNQEFETLSLRILSALFNGGYQGLLLTLAVWSGLRLFPGTNAATRHVAWLVTLLVVASLPMVHFLTTATERRPITETNLWKPVTTTRSLEITTAAEGLPMPAPVLQRLRRTPAPGAMGHAAEVVEATPRNALQAAGSKVQGAAVNAGSAWLPRTPTAQPQGWAAMRPWRASLPGELAFGLMGLWVALASIRMGKLMMECRHLWLLKRHGGPAPDRLGASFEAMRREMRVRRETMLLTVEGFVAPMAVGYWKPAVLLPSNLLPCASPGGLDQIVRHELAHLRRGDDWSNLVQQVIKALFFFHPGVWWLSRRLTLDREIACDDHVLAASSTRREYALLLTEFAGRTHYRNCSAAPAGWSRKSQLKERITMILDSKRNASTNLSKPRVATALAAAALLAAISLHAAPRLELAQAELPGTGPAATVVRASTGTAPVTTPANAVIVSTGSISAVQPARANDHAIAIVSHGPGSKPMPVPQPPIMIPAPPAAAVSAHPPHAPVPPEPFVYEEVEVDLSDIDVDLADLNVELADLHLELADLDPRLGTKPGSPSHKERDGETMEARVERLEKLIESLLAGPEIEKITRQAQEETQRAVREARRRVEESQRAIQNANIRNEYSVRGPGAAQSREIQRKMLEAQRHALEMQMNNLEAQIERLEEERDSIEERVDEHEELLESLEEEISAEVQREHEHTADEAAGDTGDKQKERSSDGPKQAL